MIFKIGDKVLVHKRCERYKRYMPEIFNHKGVVVNISKTYENPIVVSIEGVSNKYSKKGYFYFDEGDLIFCERQNGILDNFDIIDFNKHLQKITDKYGLISSYCWSDDLHGYIYDFYMDVYTDKNIIARILVKPNQIDKIDETLSNIDEHLANKLHPMPYQIKHLGLWHSGREVIYKSTKESNMLKGKIKKVIFNNPATIVFWKDGTKTVVKASNEEFDPEKGLAMAIAKKALGNEGNYFNEIKKWLPEEKPMIFEENQKHIEMFSNFKI